MELDIKELGTVLRKIRKQRGLRITDLSDERISTATISNIERGIESVAYDLRLYYCEKIGVDASTLPLLIKDEVEYRKRIEKNLLLTEARVNLGFYQEALKKLRKLHIEHGQLFPAHIRYLKGRAYLGKGNKDSAKSNFEKAIELVDEFTYLEMTNIKSACLKDLARISFHEKDIPKALEQIDQGLACFVENGERPEVKHFLKIGRASYLEKLEREDEALQTLSELWQNIGEIKNMEITLNAYEIQASILHKKKRHKEALEYAVEGFKIACWNQKYERAVELITTWGNTCKRLEDYEGAENCYLMGLELDGEVARDKAYLFISTYTELGKLYTVKKKWEKALDCLELAVEKGEKSTDIQRYCQALIALGDYWFERGLYEKAKDPYNKAHKLAVKHKLDKLDQNALTNLLELWENLNDKEKLLEIMGKLRVHLTKR